MITLEIICVEASRKTIGPLLIEINSSAALAYMAGAILKTSALELRTLIRNLCERMDDSMKPKIATFRDWRLALLAEAADDALRLRKIFASR